MKMDEKVFFEYGDVKVTNARFISGHQTYAMSNITSVKTFEQKPSRLLGIAALLIGVIVATSNAVIGLVIIAAAAYFLYQQKTIYHIMLSTSGGESSALKTFQLNYLNKVSGALNEAIVHRG